MPTDDELSSFILERVSVSDVNYMKIYIRDRANEERGKKLIVLSHGYLNPDDALKIMIPHEIENVSFYAKEGHKVFGSLPRAINGITSETLHGGDMTYNYTLSHIKDHNIEEKNISILNEGYIYSFRLIEYLKNKASEEPIILQKPEKAFLYFSYLMYDNKIEKYDDLDMAVLEEPFFTDDYLRSINNLEVRDDLTKLNTVKSEHIIKKAKELGYNEVLFLHCRAVGYTQDPPHPIITKSPEELADDFEYLNNLKDKLKYNLFNDRRADKSTSTHSLPGMFGERNGGNSVSMHSIPTKVPSRYSDTVRKGLQTTGKALRTTVEALGSLALKVFEVLDGGGVSTTKYNKGRKFGKNPYSGILEAKNHASSEKQMASRKKYEAIKGEGIKTGEVQKETDSKKKRVQSIRFTQRIEEISQEGIRRRIEEESKEHHGSKSESTHHPPPSTNSTTNSTISTNGPNSSISTAPPLEILDVNWAPVVPSAPPLEVEKKKGNRRSGLPC